MGKHAWNIAITRESSFLEAYIPCKMQRLLRWTQNLLEC